ncbi:SCO4225 family membrane protein [Streptomyces sp. NPDC002788]
MKGDTPHRPAGARPMAAGNLLRRLYLAVCAAVLVWAMADQVAIEHADASFSAVWPLLLTAPASLVWLVLPGEPLGTYVAAVVLGAVATTWPHSAPRTWRACAS